MNWLYILFYVICSVSGSTFLKLGSSDSRKVLLTVPLIDMTVSSITIIGFVCYGLSFIIYTILLSKYNLSFVSPLTIGLVYIALMVTSVIIFKESLTITSIVGSGLILLGVLLILMKR